MSPGVPNTPGRSAGHFEQAVTILQKDLRAELRNRAALNAILLFSVTTLIVVGFAIGPERVSPTIQAALLWVVLFFSAFSGLAHAFLHEEETGTSTALRLSAMPGAIYTGKLIFNLLLLGVIALVVVPLFVLMLNLNIARPGAFAIVLLFGLLGLGAAATIVAAIISKASGKGALYGALGFPILLPLLFMTVEATKLSITAQAASDLSRLMVGLLSFAVMLVTASVVLFPFVSED